MVSSVSNLSNTILGAGMLGLPFAVDAMGLGLGLIFLIICAFGAYFGLYLLTLCGSYAPKGNASFYTVARVVRPFSTR